MDEYKGEHVEIKTGRKKGQFRKASKMEIINSKTDFYILRSLREQRERVEVLIREMENKCTHKVFRDVAGHPYDARYCSACGASLGLL
jgi:hypothetical protein